MRIVSYTADEVGHLELDMTNREKLLNDLQELCEHLFHEYKACYKGDEEDTYNRFLAASNALNLLKEQQEQPEQKHGHWVSVPDRSPKTTTINMYSFIYHCSECGKAVGHHAEYNYCPGCGATMTWMVNQDES